MSCCLNWRGGKHAIVSPSPLKAATDATALCVVAEQSCTDDEDYVEGDVDDLGVASLIESDLAPHLKHTLSLSLPRETWVDTVLNSTPRLFSVDLDPSSAGSSAATSRNNSVTPSDTSSTSPPPLSPEPADSSNDTANADDVYWRRVARNMMTFNLGVHPDDPCAVVASDCDKALEDDAAYFVESTDPEQCYHQIMNALVKWVRRRHGPVGDKKTKRTSMSGRACLQSGELTLAERKHSPKMFIEEHEADDELRPFIGTAKCGVPLMRCTMLRCSENCLRTNNVTITGLLVVDINFAPQIACIQHAYSKFMLMDIVDALLKWVDFIRLSTKFVEENSGVVTALLLENYFTQQRGRVIRYRIEPGKYTSLNTVLTEPPSALDMNTTASYRV